MMRKTLGVDLDEQVEEEEEITDEEPPEDDDDEEEEEEDDEEDEETEEEAPVDTKDELQISCLPTKLQCSFFKLKYCDNYGQSQLTDSTYSGISQVIRVTVTFYSVIYTMRLLTMCE